MQPTPTQFRSKPIVAGQGEVLLAVEAASVRFGGVRALDNVTCAVYRGEICGLIGPNGAGKTTLFNCITRLYALSDGTISFAGRRIDQLQPSRIIECGIARTFQNLGLYPGMTVLENVALGAHHRYVSGFVDTLARPRRADADERQMLAACREILAELDLEDVADAPTSSLSYGTLKRVEIARALASRPQLLLLDEPAAGLTYQEVVRFAKVLGRIRDMFNVTLLLVEHNMGLVMDLCSRLLVLNFGQLLAEGTPAEVRANSAVVAAYLGDEP